MIVIRPHLSLRKCSRLLSTANYFSILLSSYATFEGEWHHQLCKKSEKEYNKNKNACTNILSPRRHFEEQWE